MTLTIEQKLDLILNEIKDHFGHLPIRQNWEQICRLVTDGDGIATGNPDFENDPELKMHIKYLDDEGYVYKFTNSVANIDYYVATTKGLLFEGFADRKNRLNIERQKNALLSQQKADTDHQMNGLQSRMVTLTKWVAFGTVLGSIAAIIAAGYYINELNEQFQWW
jgi:hypothetical protein